VKRALTVIAATVFAGHAALAQSPGTDPAWLRAGREAAALTQAGNPTGALERLAALEATCPPGKEEKAACLSTLAMASAGALVALGRQPEAEQALRRALKIREDGLGHDHPLTAEAASSLGIMLVQRRAYEEAAAQLERAVEILSKPLATGGRTAAQRADLLVTTYAQLAIAYRGQDRLPAAINVTREAVDLATRLSGPNHPATITAQVNLASLLREKGDADAAIDTLLAALQPETLPLDQRLRLAAEAAQAAAAIGRADAVQPVVDTALALMGTPEPAQRPAAIALLLAAAELDLARANPDGALALAEQAAALAADDPARRAAAQLTQARALLGQSHADRAAALLRAVSDPSFDVAAWTVRALMEAGQLDQAEERLAQARAVLSARQDLAPQTQALLLQFTATLAERRGNPTAALNALERAMEPLPRLETRPANAAQLANITRDVIRLRATLARDDAAREAAIPALRALYATQSGIGMPVNARLETKLTEAWIATELQRFDDARAAAAIALEQMPALEVQSPRAAAILLSRLAEITLAIPGRDSASNALALAERARINLERAGIAGVDLARAGTLRGNILFRLDRPADAARACRDAADLLAPTGQSSQPSLGTALACLARAESAQGRHAEAIVVAQRLLDSTPADRPRDQAEAMRLIASAQLGLGQAAAAEATLRDALARIAAADPATAGRRPAQRAEIWGDIVAALLRQGQVRDARNAAAAGRQAASEDRAGGAIMARALEVEGETLLAQDAIDEAASTFERALTLRRGRFGGDAASQAATLASLARAEAARGRFAEAGTLADTAITTLRGLPVPPRRDLATMLGLRAQLLAARGAFTAAETAQREAVALLNAGGPALAPNSAWARLALARLLALRGAPMDAEAERAAAIATLSDTQGLPAAQLAAARLELADKPRTPTELDALLAVCADAGVSPGVPGFARPEHCRVAQATTLLARGDKAGAHRLAEALVGDLRKQGDSGRPGLAAPLALRAVTAAANGDMTAALADSADAVAMADRVPLADALDLWVVRGTMLARAGEPAQAQGAFQAGLDLLTDSLPRSFSPALAHLTAGAAAALLAQDKGREAVALWQVALARHDAWPARNWPGANAARAALLRGQASALRATGQGDAARVLYQDAAKADENQLAWLDDIAGAALAAAEAGRRAQAGALIERLAAHPGPAARIAQAHLRAQAGEEGGDPVTALLEYIRLHGLAGEKSAMPPTITAPGEADSAGLSGIAAALVRRDPAALAPTALLGAARAALALGQVAQAKAYLAQARAEMPAPPPPGSDRALALLEVAAGIALAGTGPNTDMAPAIQAQNDWQSAIMRFAGPTSLPGIRALLARAALESRQGDAAEGAATLAEALWRTERLLGRASPLWSRIALQTAAAADLLGDTARAAALRKAAETARNRPDADS